MRIVTLTHALLNTPVHVDVDLIAYWYHGASTNSTQVFTTGGAGIPVRESIEQIDRLKNPKPTTKEKKNAASKA